jgi:iron-sulfur cluster assembly accessory protein
MERFDASVIGGAATGSEVRSNASSVGDAGSGYPWKMEQTTTVITVTDRAAGKIRQLAAREQRSEPVLRVRVVAGGCSGFSYELSFADAPAEDDHVIAAADGVRVLVDRRSAPIVEGSTLEFNDALLGGGLKMLNPRATHECACGDSFSV